MRLPLAWFHPDWRTCMRNGWIAAWMAAMIVAAGWHFPVAASDSSIIRVGGQEELQRLFCVADTGAEHIVVLPANLFVDSRELVCPVGSYRFYRIVMDADPDDFVYFMYPPFGSVGRLACDGKAGRAMQMIAVNCRPV